MGDWKTSAGPRTIAVVALTIAAALLLPSAGCIEIQQLLQGDDADTGGNGISDAGGPSDNANINDADGGASEPPTVRLTASSPAPLLAEQVTLRCTVIAGGGGTVTFAFGPDADLSVDANAGIATFIVNEPDLGSDLQFTCTGTNDAGTGPPSDPISVIPIESPEPPPPPEPDPAPDQSPP